MTGAGPLQVPASAEGRRADLFVAEALGLSRARVKRLFEDGAVRVNGRPARKGDLVREGQRVEVAEAALAGAEGPALVPEPGAALAVLREDAELVFVDKPAGAPSHPLQPGETGTVANALVGRYPECAAAGEDPREGGLCHRLDVHTSGVLLAARTRAAWEAMREAFSGEAPGPKAADKRYWAVVTGPIADEGEIDLPLRHHRDRVEPAVQGEDARPARSDFRVLDRSGDAALVEVRIHTGVLHQVRAHLAAIGAPVLGDAPYGGRAFDGLSRLFLHARSLEVTHPSTGKRVRVESPLPEELRAALGRLGLREPAAR
ncbi:MAG TPA: RluA family pseudouridine synthase [Myxococcales bacterium]|nr:RluA family pseudouridine synthase [Myxococcales bacterium]